MMQSDHSEGKGYCIVSTGLNVFQTPLQLKHSDLLSSELFALMERNI